MTDIDAELGPVDYLVVAFPAGQADFSGEMASELRALMDSGTVRVLDLVLVTKDMDGSVEASELRDADDSEVGQPRAAEADLAVLLAESDVEEIGGVLEPGSTAAVLVWENTWAAPFGAAVRRSGGQLVTSGRIPTQAILAAIEADRAATSGRSLTCRCSGIAVTGRACSAEAATGAMTGGIGAMTGRMTGATGAMTGRTSVDDRQDRRPRGPGLFR